MKVRVLGSAAGGGLPQWNCNCSNCQEARVGRLKGRTQSSIAVAGDGGRWVLFNASPDILVQIAAFPGLWPKEGLRDTGIAAIVLIDAQIDHTTGLFLLREGAPLEVHCTERVREDLTHGNPVFRVLEHYCGVRWHRVPIDGSPFQVAGASALRFTAVPLRSNAPPFSPQRDRPLPGDNIGVRVEDRDSGKRLFYAPGLGAMEPHLEPYLASADCLLLDGTFWSDDEMMRLGISKKRARDLGHLPQSGTGGMMEVLARYPRARKILIHINNTNPILDEASPERAELAARGIEVAWDGMEIVL